MVMMSAIAAVCGRRNAPSTTIRVLIMAGDGGVAVVVAIHRVHFASVYGHVFDGVSCGSVGLVAVGVLLLLVMMMMAVV